MSLITDFQEFTQFTPGPYQGQALQVLLNEVVAWSQALAPLRLATATN